MFRKQSFSMIARVCGLAALSVCLFGDALVMSGATPVQQAEANVPVEIGFKAVKPHVEPSSQVSVDVIFTDPAGVKRTVPGFWAGGNQWKVRYASSLAGTHGYRVQCSDPTDAGLHGVEGQINMQPYRGVNPLFRHGPIRVAADHRHFEQADGTPFFWLGDTWWKGLCKRLSWEGFQELTADRKAKGFTVVQIVCGTYPDEGAFEARWENEGGKPYETRDFSQVNPAYFDFADRRIQHLVDAGIVPVIVGGWGRSDCDGMKVAGVAGFKRHWRNLVARYGAYPTIWIVGGEASDAQWTEVAKYLHEIDPFHRPLSCHPDGSVPAGRLVLRDPTLANYDIVGGRHDGWNATNDQTLAVFTTAYAMKPPMPVLCGETAYEGHMQQNFQDVQRNVFWMYMLNGAAGHTYGAAGVWHASVEGDPGITPVYDLTTWRDGMNYPGSTQLGLGKKLLEKYPWGRFEPHPDWAEKGCFAAGIPREVRFIYQPRRGVYNWNGTVIRGLEKDVPYHAFYFNPTDGKQYDAGRFVSAGRLPKPFTGHTLPLLFADTFDSTNASAWKDYGTPSRREAGRLIGTKGMVTVLEEISETNLMASVEARSDAEVGIILRFLGPDHYFVALYSPSLKSIFLHDRKNGQWGDKLGRVPVPEVGPKIHLTAATCGSYAAMMLTDGKKSFYTSTVKVENVGSGKAGLWHYQIGNRQEYGRFELSRAQFEPTSREPKMQGATVIWSDQYKAPPLPSPQDWVLVVEAVNP
jgi:hypothetical protein